MQPVLSILREVRDPRAPNARHELSAILFIALAATLCGQQSCVHIADFGAVDEAELAEIVELLHGAPSHDCFSRVFRLLDPTELAKALDYGPENLALLRRIALDILRAHPDKRSIRRCVGDEPHRAILSGTI